MHNSTVLDNIIIRNNNINYTKISFDINNTINLLFLLMDDFGVSSSPKWACQGLVWPKCKWAKWK